MPSAEAGSRERPHPSRPLCRKSKEDLTAKKLSEGLTSSGNQPSPSKVCEVLKIVKQPLFYVHINRSKELSEVNRIKRLYFSIQHFYPLFRTWAFTAATDLHN
jgi:hypothetical protein